MRSSGSEATLGTALEKRIGLPQFGQLGPSAPLPSMLVYLKAARKNGIDLDQWDNSRVYQLRINALIGAGSWRIDTNLCPKVASFR